jgi:hypothetical protein
MEGVIGERMIGSCALSVLLAKTTGAWGLINRLTGDEVRCRHALELFPSIYLSKLCLKPKPFM